MSIDTKYKVQQQNKQTNILNNHSNTQQASKHSTQANTHTTTTKKRQNCTVYTLWNNKKQRPRQTKSKQQQQPQQLINQQLNELTQLSLQHQQSFNKSINADQTINTTCATKAKQTNKLFVFAVSINFLF